jgi:hypothetical protein
VRPVLTTYAELGEKVFHYRMAGDSIEEIADRLKMKPQTISRSLEAYNRYVAEERAHDKDSAAELELARLDRLIQCWWLDATQGQDFRAAQTVLAAIDRRVKIQHLDQLDASNPTDLQQILVIGQSQADFIRALEAGRRPALGSAETDNGIVPGTVEAELEST